MATSIHSQVHSPSLNPSQICSPSMESQTHAAADKKEAGMLQMEILEKLKHEAVSGSHDPQFLAEQLANYHKLQRSMGMSDTALGAQAAELFKREALFSSLRPKLDYFNMAALQEQQLMASAPNRMNAPPSPPRRSDTPSSSEDGGSISPNHAPPSAGGQWTYEEQFKQLYELGDEPDRRQFLDDLFAFMQKRGTPVNRIPIMAKQTLDMYKLFKLVVSKGGLVEVINKKLWREITKGLNLPSSITSAAFTLRTQYMKYIYPYECEKYDFSKASELQAAIDGNRREGRRPGYGYDMASPGAMPPFYNPQTFPAANPFFNPAMMNTSVANILSGQLNGYMNGTGLGGQMSHPRLSAPPAFPGIPPEVEERSQSPINVASPLATSNQSEMSRQDQPMNGHYTQAGSPAKRQRCMSPVESDIVLAPTRSGSFSREAVDDNSSLRRSTSQTTISTPVKDLKSLSASKTRSDMSPPNPTHIEVSDKDESNEPSVTVSIEVNGVLYRGVLFAQK